MQITEGFRICIFCRIKLIFPVLILTNMAKTISYNNKHALDLQKKDTRTRSVWAFFFCKFRVLYYYQGGMRDEKAADGWKFPKRGTVL